MRSPHRRSLLRRHLSSANKPAIRHTRGSAPPRSRLLRHEQLEQRVMLAGDLTVRFDFVATNGSAVDQMLVDNDYLINVFVRDSRTAPTGVQQAFFDVNYNQDFISVRGAIEAGAAYQLNANGDTTTLGLIDEAGGEDTDSTPPPSPGAELLLLSVPIRATSAGVLELTADLSELNSRLPLFFASDVAVPLANIDFVGGTKEILQPGIFVSPSSGLQTTEAGGQDTFQLSLLTAPIAPVTIALSSSDLSEGTVSPSSISLTPFDWFTPQTVTIHGVDDTLADGNINFEIITAPATSSDPNYSGRNAVDVSVANLDNDSVGISVQPTTGQTTEDGGTDSFQIVLNSQPTADVSITLSSDNINEGTVAPGSIIFTTTNWSTPRTIVVTGQDDDIADGNQTYSIITSAAVSNDPSYDGRPVADVSITNIDNDSAGITVQPTTGQTTESGGTDTFEILLTSRPTADVTIGIASNNTSEGTIAPASVTFTATTWNTPQIITVTGQDDDVVDGNTSFIIVTSAATSADASYNGREVADVSITNLDNDAAGISVIPTTGVTSESGVTATFAITLDSRPSADVTIGLSSSNTSEGTVAPSSVTFTPGTWDTPRQITVTGQDDVLADGNIAYSIITAPAVSTDIDYNGRKGADIALTNLDNDAVGITIDPTVGETTEAGGTASFIVVLNSLPSANVSIDLSSSDTTEGTVFPTQVTFTTETWNLPQTVTVTGQDDLVADGNMPYTVFTAPAVSTDPNYNDWNAADVALSNLDNDAAGIILTGTDNLETTEAGGTTSFQITLASQPTADVTIPLSSNDTSEGTVSPASVTFTPGNWNLAQTITIQGQDDQLVDGDVTYRIVTAPAQSTDAAYLGRDAADIDVTNRDDDVALVEVTPTTGLTTSEAGTSASFEIRLASQPSDDVTITLASSDPGEGTVNASSVLFTPANWNIAQSFAVTGVNDEIADGDIAFTIITGDTVSSDSHYHNLVVSNVSVVNADDDVANMVVTPTSGLDTSEDGGQATFSIVLTSEPTSNVAIQVTSNDPQEGTTDPTLVTFTPSNWNTERNVTVRGEDDSIVDGNVSYDINVRVASTDDSVYASLDPVTVTAINRDNDSASIVIIGGESLVTSENGDTATFSIVLTAQPTSNVVVSLTSTDSSEGSTATDQMTFTPTNWNSPQAVTVTGADDPFVDGDKTYTITGTPSSGDPVYDNLAPVSASVVNNDNDSAQLILSTTAATLVEGTDGGNDRVTFKVELVGAVESGFTLGYATNDGTATTASSDYVDNDGFIIFSGTDGESHTGQVEVVADNILEADEVFTVAFVGLSEISPSAAARIDPVGTPLEFTIQDDDDLTISFFGVSQDEGTNATPSSFQFDVVLSNPVQGGLRIAYTTNDDSATLADNDYIDNDATLEFTATAADESRSIEVLVTADAAVERDETFVVSLDEIVFLDPGLADSIVIDGGSQTGTIVNDDTANIAFTVATSLAIEVTGSHFIEARLSVSGGGTLTEEATIELLVLPGATAVIPDDYTLSGTTFTFPAGSRDGEIRMVDMLLIANDGDEGDELAGFGLELVEGAMDGQVTIGEPAQLEVTLTEDPFTSSVSGTVWFDANNNGRREIWELPIPGVVVALSGTDSAGQIVEITRMTNSRGAVQFERLPAGTYTLVENQPQAFFDGRDILGTVAGAPMGQLLNDRMSNIVLAPAEAAVGYRFGERQLATLPISRRLFFASTPPLRNSIRDVVANAEEKAGDKALADAIRRGESVEMRRIGSTAEVTGTSLDDLFTFVPATSVTSTDNGRHVVSVNGLQWGFVADQVTTIRLNSGRGGDEVELYDSRADDLLTATHDEAILSSDDFRVDAMAFDLVRAISSSGGEDRVIENDFHNELELEGPWGS